MESLGRGIQRFRMDAFGLTRYEKYCLCDLLDSHSKLEQVNGSVVTGTREGREACQAFLASLVEVADKLSIERACRSYRKSFTTNYKLLFPDYGRNYRVDVFAASIDQNQIIYVNHEKHEFSIQTLSKAQKLQEAWKALSGFLKSGPLSGQWIGCALDDLYSALTRLDTAWASFEQAYISELIGIEAKARELIVQTVEQESLLACAERQFAARETPEGAAEVRARRLQLAAGVARLNSVANQRRKGRGDLDGAVLEEALAELRADFLATHRSAAAVLAGDLVGAFEAVRAYLRQVASCLERVDPHLCNNQGLVDRLVDLEESWEIGMRYRRLPRLLSATSDVVAELRDVQEVAPALKQMCDDCDVELFLCVPRLLWLRFLHRPAACGELLRTLLPHRFLKDNEDAAADAAFPVDGELSQLRGCHCRARELLLRAHPLTSRSPKSPRPCLHDGEPSTAAWELLARRAVAGSDGARELSALLLPPTPEGEAARAAVEVLMRELERWSIELQRHAPDQWNQTSSLLVQCLVGGAHKAQDPPGEFFV